MLSEKRVIEEHYSTQRVSVEFEGEDAVVLIDTEASGEKRWGTKWRLGKDETICEIVFAENGEREVFPEDKAPIGHLRIVRSIAEKLGLKTPKSTLIES